MAGNLESKLKQIELMAQTLAKKNAPCYVKEGYCDWRFNNGDFSILCTKIRIRDEPPSEEEKITHKTTIKYRPRDGRFFDVVYASNELYSYGEWEGMLRILYFNLLPPTKYDKK